MAGDVITHRFFTVLDHDEHGSLPLPGQKHLVADSEKEVISHMQQDGYIRCYTKNGIYTGKHVTTKLWVGDYRAKDTFMELAEESVGIKRLAVLRADVDNLGTTFVSGFRRADGDEQYATLSKINKQHYQEQPLFHANYLCSSRDISIKYYRRGESLRLLGKDRGI